MSMKLVYIAGPYTAPTYREREQNIDAARSAAIWCAQNLIGYFCPHLNSAHMDLYAPETPITFWYEMDWQFADCCDAILLIDGWHNSHGASLELNLFECQGKPSFNFPEECNLILEWGKK